MHQKTTKEGNTKNWNWKNKYQGNLSKAHLTCDSSGPATWAISVGLHCTACKNNNGSWRSIQTWSLRMEDFL